MLSIPKKFPLIFTCLFILNGCNNYKTKSEINSDVSLNTLSEEALTKSAFSEGQWPDRYWWEIFNDAQLSLCIEKALENSPTIKKVEARFHLAEQHANSIRASLFPELNAGYLERWQYFSKNGFVRSYYPMPEDSIKASAKANIIDFSFNFIYEFDFWGKNRKLHKAALGRAKAELAEKIQSELILSTLVAFSYFELQMHISQEILYTKALENIQESLALNYQRTQAGLDNLMPQIGIDKQLYSYQQKLSEVKKSIQIDALALKVLMGLSPDTAVPFIHIPAQITQAIPLPKNIGAGLLARRADLMAMIWKVEAAAQEVGAAKREYYPNFNLMAFTGLQSLQFPDFLNWASRQGALQPTVNLPIFSGGKLQANLSGKKAFFNEAVEAYNESLLQAIKEVATEIASLSSIYERIELQNQIIQCSLHKEQLIDSRFQKGLDNYMSYLQANTETINQEIHQVELTNYKVLSLIKLMKSLGGGFSSDDIPSVARKG
ncbi:MAG: efflux transporter outer membrane subunit [Chlamydiae bacterium]|nr:efflux transporter outer membrane subunit [Chlamydiota bacterium]